MAYNYDRPRKEIFMTRDAYNNMLSLFLNLKTFYHNPGNKATKKAV